MDRLGQFADNIDWFGQFRERLYLVTKGDRVYAFGNQTKYENLFGLQNSSGSNLTKPTEIVELRGKKIVKFTNSVRSMLALSADGQVWAWGWNGVGTLGDGTTTDRSTPVLVQTIDSAVDIVSAEGSSFALTGSGRTFAWGANSYGECGNGHITRTPQSSPQAVHLDQVVVSLQATLTGTMAALTNTSQLYVWGWLDHSLPTLVAVPSKVVSVATNFIRYYALTEEGHIWRSMDGKQLDVEVLYNGTTKFKAIYADQRAEGLLVAESIDGQQLWMWPKADHSSQPPVKIEAKDIVHAFAIHDRHGYLPFMVKLNGNTTRPV